MGRQIARLRPSAAIVQKYQLSHGWGHFTGLGNGWRSHSFNQTGGCAGFYPKIPHFAILLRVWAGYFCGVNQLLYWPTSIMENRILGLHHVTAISGNAQRNYDFYTKVLGMRFVKKTVNFDDPHTYHLYYGDYPASPGTIMTFFPWEHITKGRRGTGQATEVGFSVPAGSLEFWQQRMEAQNVVYNNIADKFGERYLTIVDPDGLKLELTEAQPIDERAGYATDEVGAANGIKGFHQVTLTLRNIKSTAEVLTDVFGYQLVNQHVNRYRFATDATASAAIIDLVEAKGEAQGTVAGGSVHHIAFRVQDDATEMKFRELVASKGLDITPQIDRNYFRSLYFREPGGVLFEIATDTPGFTVDEPVESLGQALQLPAMYEKRRAEIEKVLPILQ